MITIGTRVGSDWTTRLVGTVVGFGTVCWPSSENVGGDAGVMQLVYLVQVAEASSALGPACVVMRADRVYEVEP